MRIFLLSVQCNTLHGTEYKITCGVCLCVFLSVCLCVRTGFGGQISRKRLEIEVRLQWDTNRKWHMADRLVTWRGPMTSRDLERSFGQCVWGRLSRKWMEIETRLQWSTYRKWHLGNQKVTWQEMSCDPDRSRSWHQYVGPIMLNMTGDTRWVMTSCDRKLLGHPDIFG